MSRLESRARTVEQLVDTATELFISDGYRQTSLATVADTAGFSTGAVYSNFAGKSDLGLAVLDRLRARALAELVRAFEAAGDLDSRLDALAGWAERELGDSDWPRLELEFALDARNNPVRVEEIATRQRAARDGLTALLDGISEPGAEPALAPRDLSRVLISIGVGYAMQRMVDPQVSPHALRKAVRALLAPTPLRN